MADNNPTHKMVAAIPTEFCAECFLEMARQFGWDTTMCLTCDGPIGHSDCVHFNPFPVCEIHAWEEIALHAGMDVAKAKGKPHSNLEAELIKAIRNYMFVTDDYEPVKRLRQEYRLSLANRQ